MSSLEYPSFPESVAGSGLFTGANLTEYARQFHEANTVTEHVVIGLECLNVIIERKGADPVPMTRAELFEAIEAYERPAPPPDKHVVIEPECEQVTLLRKEGPAVQISRREIFVAIEAYWRPAAPAAVAGHIPFDLDRAKAGDALVTRDGRVAYFIGYDETAPTHSRLTAYVKGQSDVRLFYADGRYASDDTDIDLFMAEPVKKPSVWVNYYAPGHSLGVLEVRYKSHACATYAAATAAPGTIWPFAVEVPQC
jgi:hypothetical protein